MTPAVTYIVSAYDRPQALRCCLASIQLQIDDDFECVVADNGLQRYQGEHARIVAELRDQRFSHVSTAWHSTTPAWDCYWSAEWIMKHGGTTGEFICLPSDDSYYVPLFQEAMLAEARACDLSLVYCDMLYDRRGHGKYHVKAVAPRVCEIDKTCFMLKRNSWIGFPNKPQQPISSNCDGEMIVELVSRGIRHGRVAEPLVVHN